MTSWLGREDPTRHRRMTGGPAGLGSAYGGPARPFSAPPSWKRRPGLAGAAHPRPAGQAGGPRRPGPPAMDPDWWWPWGGGPGPRPASRDPGPQWAAADGWSRSPCGSQCACTEIVNYPVPVPVTRVSEPGYSASKIIEPDPDQHFCNFIAQVTQTHGRIRIQII